MFGNILRSQERPDFLWKPQKYIALGVKIGIKARRQVNLGEKLLCNCPVTGPVPDYDVEISRHLRSAAADPSTSAPPENNRFYKEVIYRFSRKTACTYEMDDSPPIRLNLPVLSGAKALARSIGCNIPAITWMMREQMLDGSIPSGFQRSMLIGWGCGLPFLKNRLGIQRVTLAEDTARLVGDSSERLVFMTDRLGVPLLVITTYPNLHTPEDAAAAARLLRMITSAMPGAMHDNPALRFDIRVSIKGGAFVDILGLETINHLVHAVHHEIVRQSNLAKLPAKSDSPLKLPETDMPAVRLDQVLPEPQKPDMPWDYARAMEKKGLPLKDIRTMLEHRWP